MYYMGIKLQKEAFMWAEANFTLSDAAVHKLFGTNGKTAKAFRKCMAALDTKHGIGLPPVFFGYGDDGTPNSKGDTIFAMGYTHNGLRILANSSTAVDILAQKIGSIHAALMVESNCIIPLNQRSGEHSANFVPFQRHFFIRTLVLGHHEETSFWCRAARAVEAGSTWLQEADRKLPLSIGSGVMRQAVGLLQEGDDLDGNIQSLLAKSISGGQHWAETGQEFGRRLGVKMHAVGGHTYIPIGSHRVGRVALKNVEFSMRGDLDGPWLIGRLKIEAGGELVPATGAWTQQNSAAA